MMIVSVLLIALWMAFALLGYSLFGFTHLLWVGAVAIEVLRPQPKRI
jgi:hypothetical protein